jgi:hypothetical protein
MDNWGDYAELVGPLLLTFLLGLLSRPWVDRLIRRERRSEEDKIYWTTEGRNIVTTLEAVLETGLALHRVVSDECDDARRDWNEHLRARVKNFWHYSPNKTAADTGKNVMLRFDRLTKNAFALSKAHNLDGPARNKAETRFRILWGEAAQALDEFREANGGRPATPRDSSIYALEDDGSANS